MRPNDLRPVKTEPVGRCLPFTFEGAPRVGIEGETVFAALSAAGHFDLHQVGPGTQHGGFCGMGACQDCLVEIDGRGAQRACMTKLLPDMVIVRHDPDRAILAPLAPRPVSEPIVEELTAVVVGAGPAGLAAAEALALAGLPCTILDERDAPGGQYFKQLAASQRFRDGGEDAQFRAGRELIERVTALGVDIRPGHTVWHAGQRPDGRTDLGILAGDSARSIVAGSVLLATGAYERAHQIPGWTLPGVMSTGAAQTLARRYRVSPGQRVLVAGNGPLNWQVAIELAEGGVDVVAVVEQGRPMRPAGLASALGMLSAAPGLALAGLSMRLALRRRGIPLIEAAVVTSVSQQGDAKAARVLSHSDGQEQVFTVDAVLLGYGFAPAAELARQLGVSVNIDPATGFARPVVDKAGRVGGRAIWIAGDAAGIGGSQLALARGEAAGQHMARHLGKDLHQAARYDADAATRFQKHLWNAFAAVQPTPAPPPATVVCRCEGVTAGEVATLRAAGVRDLGSLKRQSRLGMGRCQGRYCSGAALRLLRGDDVVAIEEAETFAPRAPARPVPAMSVISEKAEWGGHAEVDTSRVPPSAVDPDPLPAHADLLVIGAGITGTSTALFAARAGWDTLVIDRSPPNSQASGGNAGSLHVQLLSWDFGKKAMAGGHPALRTLPLQRDSVDLWKSLERELGADFEIVTTGGLMVAENEAQTSFLRAKAEAERAVGVDVEVIGRNELADLAPAISDRMVVASYSAAEGKINPLKATPALVNAAQKAGARFASGHDVIDVARDGELYRVATRSGSVTARRVVIAAGGWSRHIGQMLGVDLPIQGAPLQMLVTERTRPMLKQLVAHADRHLTMKQASNGNLIIGGAWTAGMDDSLGYSRVLRSSIEGNLWVAERTVPLVGSLHLLRSWAAMNINIDGAPLLGPLPGHPDVFIAATANGYTLGPLMGQLTAALAIGGKVGRALEDFTLQRFR